MSDEPIIESRIILRGPAEQVINLHRWLDQRGQQVIDEDGLNVSLTGGVDPTNEVATKAVQDWAEKHYKPAVQPWRERRLTEVLDK